MSDDALLRRTYQHLSEADVSQDAQLVAMNLLPDLSYRRAVWVAKGRVAADTRMFIPDVCSALSELVSAGILERGETAGTYRIRHPARVEAERRGWRVVGGG